MIAIVVGGSQRVWEDVSAAERLCHDSGLTPRYFACNDMIQRLPEPCIACTLHPDKLGTWMTQRQCANKYPMPSQVWSHEGGDNLARRNPYITHRLKDWGGSVGLFSYQVAREREHDRIILCGVPMTRDNHFVRGTPWNAQPAFTRSWENHREEMRPYVRSMSGGWTEELFGKPDANWINR